MASIDKTEDLQSFDIPEVTRHPDGYTIYKIVLQITPKEFTQNSYQVFQMKIFFFSNQDFCFIYSVNLLETLFRNSKII